MILFHWRSDGKWRWKILSQVDQYDDRRRWNPSRLSTVNDRFFTYRLQHVKNIQTDEIRWRTGLTWVGLHRLMSNDTSPISHSRSVVKKLRSPILFFSNLLRNHSLFVCWFQFYFNTDNLNFIEYCFQDRRCVHFSPHRNFVSVIYNDKK